MSVNTVLFVCAGVVAAGVDDEDCPVVPSVPATPVVVCGEPSRLVKEVLLTFELSLFRLSVVAFPFMSVTVLGRVFPPTFVFKLKVGYEIP